MRALKSFWSNYSANIVRFWTNQIVMSIVGVSVGLATIAFDNFTLSLIGCFFTIGLLCFLQYDNMCQLGEKHHFMHRDMPRPGKGLGFKIALFGYAPLLILIILGAVMEVAFQYTDGSTVCNLIYYGIHGTYIQTHAFVSSLPLFDTSDFMVGILRWSACAMYILPVVICSGIGYFLGAKDIPLRSLFGVKVSSEHH